MAISNYVEEAIEKGSWIRKLFETGGELKKKYGVENVQDLSLGNPILEPPKEFYEMLHELSTRRDEGLHRYMNNGGYPHVREAVAKFLTQHNIMETDGTKVVMSVGAGGALNVICKTLLNSGDEMIVLAPFFPEYFFYIRNHGGKVVVIETKEDFQLDLGKIEAAFNEKTKGIILNSPNNPTGVVYHEEDLKQLRALVAKVNEKRKEPLFIISDEPYREVYFDEGMPPSPISGSPYGILVYSWSKALSIPGERIGYIAVPKDCPIPNLVDGFICCTRILGFINAPATQQYIVEKLLETKLDLSIYRRDREVVLGSLKEAGYELTEPHGAFYVFPKSPIPDDIEFCKAVLEKYQVLIVPGTGFGRPGYFRISYAVDSLVIDKAMEKMKKIRKEY